MKAILLCALAALVLFVASPAAAEEAPPLRASVWVHLATEPDVALETMGDAGPQFVCHAPCDVEVPLDEYYRVTGPGILPSKGFRLHALPGEHVVLEVNGASASVHDAGHTTMVAGGVLAAAGGAVLVFVGGAVLVCIDSGGSVCGVLNNTTAFVGAGIGGFAALGAGGVIALTGFIVSHHGATDVSQSAEARRTSTTRTAQNDRWLRLPTWVDHTETAGTLPAAMSVPLFSRTF